jgi:hypothetical protein
MFVVDARAKMDAGYILLTRFSPIDLAPLQLQGAVRLGPVPGVETP